MVMKEGQKPAEIAVKFGKSAASDGPVAERAEYAFGPFRLNGDTRELRRGDDAVALTPKAFDTLHVLVAFNNRVVEKDELLRVVWPDAVVGDETLTQNIATIRRALGDNSDQPDYVATVPKHGYRFIAPVQVLSAPSADPARESGQPSTQHRQRTVVIAFAGLSLLIGLVLGWGLSRSYWTRVPSTPTRFVLSAPDGAAFSASASFPAVSPNGRLVAFLAARPGEATRIWVQSLDALSARELVGTDNAVSPFWSPDSQSLAFVSLDHLKTVNLLGEPPRVLAEVARSNAVPSGSWNPDGVILFSNHNVIMRIPSSGGTPVAVTRLDAAQGEAAHELPEFLPDGQHFLYLSKGREGISGSSWIVVASLNGSDHRRLIHATSQAEFAAPGYLVFTAGGALVAQAFDARARQLAGPPAAIVGTDPVGINPATPRGMFGVSQTGMLAYRPAIKSELGWYDRTGTPLEWVSGTDRDFDPAVSPDGTRLAVSRFDPATGTRNVWLLDLKHGAQAAMLTPHLSWAACPVWSPDGARITFESGAAEGAPLYELAVAGRADHTLLPGGPTGCPTSWTSDGRALIYTDQAKGGDAPVGVAYIPAGGGVPTHVSGAWANRPTPRVSPNGRWIAYVSQASERREVFVQAFPRGNASPLQVSLRGGIEPQWRADGRELYFIGLDKQLMAAPVTEDAKLHVGPPTALFQTTVDTTGVGITGRSQYIPDGDGKRFLIKQPRPGVPPPGIAVVLDWTTLLKR
jgi:eukaryotic-like serine/threonine-protein kinase